MALYRYQIAPLSAFSTPMRSDTLYGHLLWAAAMLHGEKRVTELIEAFVGENPPFRLSSAFPSGRFPFPSLPGIPRRRFKEQFAGQGSLVEMLKHYKNFRKTSLWSVDDWLTNQGRVSQEGLFTQWLTSAKKSSSGNPPELKQVKKNLPHVTIDRQTGSVLDQGGLFFSSATWYRPGQTLDLYVETSEMEFFEKLLRHLADTGFGADRSTGKGHFAFRRDDHFDPTPFARKGTHRLSLSVCAATETSVFAGYWTPFVKHGRTWSGFGERNPFKKPFLAFAEGSLFSAMPTSGYVLRNIHSDPKLVQIGWPLTIPVILEGHDAD